MAAEAAQGGDDNDIPLQERVPLVTAAGHPSGQGDDDDDDVSIEDEHDSGSVNTIGSGSSRGDRHHHPTTTNSRAAAAAAAVVAEGNATGSKPGSLTRLNGLALVISLQIGSGIFTVPSQVASFTTTPGWALTCWFVAGLLVWTGAASFVELGVRFPRNGGIQEYLRACYGDFMGFLFAWTWVVLAKPAAQAAIATISARYLLRALMGIAVVTDAADADASDGLARAVALLCIALVTFINCLGATTGARAANLFLFLKLAALGTIIAVGFVGWVLGDAGGVPSDDDDRGWFGLTPEMARMSPWEWMGNFATATFGALFCYGGWETIGFVAGDMANSRADLPVVIHGAMITVITSFCLMNAALFVCLPVEVIRASKTVAVEFARRTLGAWGGLVFSVVVSISALGALNSNTFALAKICVAASHRGFLPAILANLHCASAGDEADYLRHALGVVPAAARYGVIGFSKWTQSLRWHRSVPIYALLLNGFLSALFVLVGSFNGLFTLIGLTEYLHFFLSAVGLLILRRGEPSQPGSGPRGAAAVHRTWIGNPLIFSLVSGLLILSGVSRDPLQGAVIVAVLLLGLGVFYLRFGLRGFWTRSDI